MVYDSVTTSEFNGDHRCHWRLQLGKAVSIVCDLETDSVREAGGFKHYKELLVPLGLDASDTQFWDKRAWMISSFVDELEAIEG